MQVKLLQALHVEGKLYPLGVQDIPEEKLKHAHFHKYIQLGLVVEPDHTEVIKPETMQERGKRLAEKLHKAPKAKAAAPAPVQAEAEEELPQGEPSFGEDGEDDSEEKEVSKKSKHKQKR